MKTNNLPDSWCVESDCSQEYIDTVIKYISDKYNTHYGGTTYKYYGIHRNNKPDYWDYPFGKQLTLEQFKQMTNTIKPFYIKGKEHQLKAIGVDLVELGYIQSEYNDKDFLGIYLGVANKIRWAIDGAYNNEKVFQLPQDYQAALDYAKEYLTTIKPTEVKYTINASKNIEVVIKKDGVYEGSNRYPIGFIIDLKDLFDKPIKGIELYKLPSVPFNIDSVAIGCTSGITRQHIEDILKLYKQNFE